MLSKERIIEIFKETGVMLTGHFQLTSGRHSDHYMQCAQLFQYPEYSEMMCAELAEYFHNEKIDLVAGPAVGGIIIAYETARALKVRNIFAERQNGVMTFRRGFAVQPAQAPSQWSPHSIWRSRETSATPSRTIFFTIAF